MTRPQSILIASFVVTSFVGAASIAGYWLSSDAGMAFIRASLFVVVVAAVHWIGYRLYDAQESPVKKSPDLDFSLVRQHLPMILFPQFACLILGAVLLDGGRGFRTCIVAIIAHWVAIIFCAARERSELTALNRFVIRWGLFPCLACTVLLSSMVL